MHLTVRECVVLNHTLTGLTDSFFANQFIFLVTDCFFANHRLWVSHDLVSVQVSCASIRERVNLYYGASQAYRTEQTSTARYPYGEDLAILSVIDRVACPPSREGLLPQRLFVTSNKRYLTV